uniref:Uncharacterized protein n=1 Tax=Cucumis melo TaxID=3656 RepID=A0A9I9EAY5_CUCME
MPRKLVESERPAPKDPLKRNKRQIATVKWGSKAEFRSTCSHVELLLKLYGGSWSVRKIPWQKRYLEFDEYLSGCQLGVRERVDWQLSENLGLMDGKMVPQMQAVAIWILWATWLECKIACIGRWCWRV